MTQSKINSLNLFICISSRYLVVEYFAEKKSQQVIEPPDKRFVLKVLKTSI